MVWNQVYFIDDWFIDALRLIFKMQKTHQMAPLFRNSKKSPKISDISTTHPCPGMLWVSKEAELQGVYKIFGLVHCFSVRMEKSWKMSWKTVNFCAVLRFFKLFSILSEKQRTKPKILKTPWNSASFDTYNIPGYGWVVGWKEILSKIPVCLSCRAYASRSRFVLVLASALKVP